jgi:hypothetical protein
MCNNVDSEVENKLYNIYRDLIYKLDALKSMTTNRTGTTRLTGNCTFDRGVENLSLTEFGEEELELPKLGSNYAFDKINMNIMYGKSNIKTHFCLYGGFINTN